MNQDGRADAFEAVVAEVYEPLQRYLRRRCASHDLDDVLNDALLTIWRRIDDIPEDHVLAWCYGVARRSLANQRRGEGRRLALVARAGAAMPTATPVDDAWSDDDIALHAAVGRLGDLDREVVRLWAWENLEPREIAAALGVTPNAVSVRLGRVRRRLRVELERQIRSPAGHEADEDHPELKP